VSLQSFMLLQVILSRSVLHFATLIPKLHLELLRQ
jgi:hypothetical protein